MNRLFDCHKDVWATIVAGGGTIARLIALLFVSFPWKLDS